MKWGAFLIRDEWFVIVIEKLMDMISFSVYVQSCDTEMLRWIGKKCKQHSDNVSPSSLKSL